VPAHVSGIIPQAAPGAELACRAHNLPSAHLAAPRGVISYYATLALPDAPTLADWLAGIDALAGADFAAGRLSLLHRPHLRLLGHGGQPTLGR